ncbi:Gfo/Idh/MocA family oxidoreductase [Candidatus Sumerlaeota bacterium]|nr:Gfo/Idh/MocA family oxidoreductase [Candidatus Sumerlaeota bacterium]
MAAITRRDFVGKATAAATFSIVPGFVLGRRGKKPPSERLNIAAIGCGGRAQANLKGLATENFVALCDPDESRAAKAFEQIPKAKRFRDFRKMLDEMDKQIDAVVVSTPDHTHAVAVMMAIRMGKHVYCEKPLARTIYEVRQIMKAARKHKVATQLGNQGHSSDDIRKCCEWIWDGAIGEVREVHAMFSGSYNTIALLDRIREVHEVPSTLDWDLWLGPVPFRPFHPFYINGGWRRWTRFGTGGIGDFACHVLDPSFWALKLGAPVSVEAETKNYDPVKHAETWPPASIVRYEFPARGDMPPLKLTWHEGGLKPPRPEEMGPMDKMPDTGAIIVGSKGKMVHSSHGAGGVRIIPREKMKEYKQPPPSIPRVQGHYEDWVEACKGRRPAGSNFDYGGPLTEVALLGGIAMRRPGIKLLWNGKKMRFTNDAKANEYLSYKYRRGWKL